MPVVLPVTVDVAGQWVLAEEEDVVVRARVEVSKNSQAKCRVCQERVMKGSVRIGKPGKTQWGIISGWHHDECFVVSDGGGPISHEQVHGLDDIPKDVRPCVLEALGRLTPLRKDEALNPENPDFLKRRNVPPRATPKHMVTSLLPFQQEGLGWLLDQEANMPVQGGLLCDEMGMGKTIQTIALIVERKMQGIAGPTLVVAPSSAMLQWLDEARSNLHGDFLKVVVYHGNGCRGVTPKDLLEADMVLTSYPVLEHNYRRCLNRAKVPCPYCSRLYLPRKLVQHNEYFCGPNSRRTAKQALTEKKALDEKNKETMKKAMRTLNIGTKHSLPTPSNIYRELMEKANRTPVMRFVSREEAQRLQRETKAGRPAKPDESTSASPSESSRRSLRRSVRAISPATSFTTDAASSSGSSVDDDLVSSKTRASGLPRPHQTPAGGRARVKTRLSSSLWAALGGEIFIAKAASGRSPLWASNLLDTARERFQFRQSFKQHDLPSGVRLEAGGVKVFISEGGLASVSVDKGRTWLEWVQGSWAPHQEALDSLDKFWGVSDKLVGRLVARDFDGSVFLGVVISHAKKTKELPEMWKVQHCDGDVEDLDREETQDALSMAEDYLKPGSSTMKCAEVLSAFVGTASRGAQEVDGSRKRSSSRSSGKPVVNDSSDESDFEPDDSSSSDSESGSESDGGDSSSNRVEQVSAGRKSAPVLRPAFAPATWGPGSQEAKTLAYYLTLRSGSTAGKRRRSGKAHRRSDRKAPKDQGSADACSKRPKRASGARGSPSKKLDPDPSEASSESDVDSDEGPPVAPPDVDISRVGPNEFWYANKGNVVDDDGVDLGTSLLHVIPWTRIVLDEAHKIKDRTNSTAKSALALRGRPVANEGGREASPLEDECHRWCLTGTPLQNRIGELYSLVRFLRVPDYAYYLCKAPGCDCKTLHWGDRYCGVCGHTPMKHYSYFNKMVINPIKRNGYVGEGEKAMRALRDDLLGTLMLRRTKEERQKDMNLPPTTTEIRVLHFGEHERDFYESVYKNTRARFDTFVKKGTLMHNYAHIFELLSKLRRAADHPYLVIHGGSADRHLVAMSKSTKMTDVCGICQFDIESLGECAMATCRHTFHKDCVEELLESTANADDDTKQESAKKAPKPKGRDGGAFRQPDCPVCLQPFSITLELRGGSEGRSPAVGPQTDDDDVCVVCMDQPRDALLAPCGHIYMCAGCAKALEKKACPMCRTEISKVIRVNPNAQRVGGSSSSRGGLPQRAAPLPGSAALVGRKSIVQSIDSKSFANSCKVEGVLAEVRGMLKEKREDTDLPNKAIVFSQYNDMLDLVQWRLRTMSVKTVKLIGSLPMSERRSVLSAFKSDPSVSVLLMSLKAGGEGLNLQEASHVFVLEPWWNPAVEMQAIQRAHRIGQRRAVKAVRFMVKDSIEEKMLELQEKKMLIFEGAIDGSQAALAKLSAEDLRFLFSK